MANTVTIDLRHLARGLEFPLRQVQAVVELLDEGNTVPFITRYRKDQTGGLDEEQIREIQDRLAKSRMLAERKQTILRSIEAQGKLTEKLAKQILGAATTKRLEDLYLPFKPKKQTLATLARSRGLEELATEILEAAPAALDLDARARDFASVDRQVPSGADALLGAGHILAEQFSERADLRQRLREIMQKSGKIVTTQIVVEAPAAEPDADAPAEAPAADSSFNPEPGHPRSGSATGSAAVSQEETTTAQPTAEAIEAPAAEAMSEATTPEASQPAEVPAVETPEAPAAAVEVVDIVAEMAPSPENVEPASGVADDNIEHPAPTASSESEAASGETSEIAAAAAPAAAPPPLAAAAARRARERERARRKSRPRKKPRSARPTNAAPRPSATTSITPRTSRRSRRTASWPSTAPSGPRCCA